MNSKQTKPVFFFSILIVFLCIIISFGCGKKPSKSTPPNIILITVDTLRWDHLSYSGYNRLTTPFMDTLSRQAVSFSHAYSTSSWTAPSMASIFTGLYPSNHGVIHGIAQGSNAAITGQEELTHRFLTIAEALKSAGYTTFGVSSNGHLTNGTGFAQGFDYFQTHWFDKSPATNNSVKTWLNLIRNAKNYFLWVHYFDPHNPYAPQMPWIKQYVLQSGSYSKWTREVIADPREYIEDLKKDKQAIDTLIDRYDSEINFCDRQIQELLELLKPGSNTIIIITADHGEAFLDHGQVMHGDTVYEEEIRVPLIIKLPGANPNNSKQIHQPVSNKDIFKTIMDVSGLKSNEDIPGESLMPAIQGKTTGTSEYVVVELDRDFYYKAILSGNLKYVFKGKNKNERFLFDLNSDTGENRNIVNESLQVAGKLEDTLDRWMNNNPEHKAPKIRIKVDRDNFNKLKSLGYL